MNGFLKNPKLLEEDCKVEDLLGFSAQIAKLRARIDAITRPAIIALTGAFGIGKSTMLHQMQKQDSKDKKILWILFDAWKYPNRKDLWEGFVLDFADQVKRKGEIMNALDGKSNVSRLAEMVGKITGLFSSFFAALAGLFQKMVERSPATRVFQIQEILAGLINSQSADKIIFVLEDTDRSGEAGMLFLETFNQFLKNLETDKTVVAVAPVSDTYYSENQDRYLKAVEYSEPFKLEDVKLEMFIDRTIADELLQLNDWYAMGQLVSFLDALMGAQKITMRDVKFILRNSNDVYKHQIQRGLSPDFRVVICFGVLKFLPKTDFNIVQSGRFPVLNVANSVISAFLCAIMGGHSSIYEDYDDKKLINWTSSWLLLPRSQTKEVVPYKLDKKEYGADCAIVDFYYNME